MLYPDLDLSRRLEYCEAQSSLEHARVQRERCPDTGADWLARENGGAVFCGRRSPLSQVYALGMAGDVSDDLLDEIEAFYAGRDMRTHVRVCPLAHPSLVALLGQRGYTPQAFMNAFARRVTDRDAVAPQHHRFVIHPATDDETAEWFERSGAGGDWAEPDGVTFMTIRCALKPGARLFIASLDGVWAGCGAIEVRDGVAALMAAETRPEYRNLGVQSALLHARLSAAAALGCDLAVVHTTPGTVSQRNVLRAGFQLAYTTVRLVSPPAGDGPG